MSANATSEIDALSDTLSAVFSALSDPTRRAMLARLSQGEASVNELAAPFKMSLPAVSKHIKVLQKAGLLTKTINAQQRPCKIDGAQLNQAVDWMARYTIKSIASQAVNTLARGKNGLKKQAKPEKSPKNLKVSSQVTTKATLKSNAKPQEKPHDQEPNDLQQQIGFDF
jgi:DNA-binding transcriptional ArsR family regulator